ncbi:CoA-binding protein [Pyxidicoccus fallax]|uniref:CoA-binding protein n=1 Tax=Pyxidicoccus fallax TaxID=394095 RepID=A0A848LD88_9BACT|nr:CoA-binding protein [Pyxidicoccus fallax]NMO16384.1 CoA-binding protein [Pyxidicoccus fallax]NPC86695.1 CoA-binding protein [Pyxidicoccus fallax]
MDWKDNLVEDDAGVQEVLARGRRIAVLGIRSERDAHKPAYAVPHYLQKHGYDIVPVSVHGEREPILGQPVYSAVADVPGAVDVVDVFRKPEDIDAHVDDLLAKKPRAVWFQLGIRNDAAAERLARAGIRVVQDRCMKLELMKLEQERQESAGSGAPA